MSDDLVKRLREWWDYDHGRLIEQALDRIEELEAELAKAVEALEFLEIAATGAGVPHPKERELLQNCIRKARAALADIEGEQP